MISNRLILYVVLIAGGAAALWLYGESREQDGYNRAIAEHSQAVAEWHEQQKAEHEKELAKERAKAKTLLSDLSILRGDFAALQSEVSDAPIIKPVVQGVPDCTAYNPLSAEFARLFNAGASGGRDSQTAADSGDGPMPRPTE